MTENSREKVHSMPQTPSYAELEHKVRELEAEVAAYRASAANLQEIEDRYHTLFEQNQNPIAVIDTEGRYLDANPAFLDFVEKTRDELLRMRTFDFANPEKRDVQERVHRGIWETGGVVETEYFIHGRTKVLELSITPVTYQGRPAVVGVGKDITERKRTEAELRFQSQVLNQIQDRITATDLEGRIVYVNDAELKSLKRSREELMGQPVSIYGEDPSQGASQRDIIDQTRRLGEWRGEVVNYASDGTPIVLDCRTRLIRDQADKPVSMVGISTDITEKEQLQQRLRQAQKMEAVGRLAGGVAHDFNNMLGVILGHAELALEQIEASHPLHTDLKEINTAAQRSADLTRQLLAFARRQTASPQILDLNATIDGMLKMLRRLIGEDIDLTWMPGDGLWPVKIDPAQIDQILANLCVNARDAIAGVGSISIETQNIRLDEEYCAKNAGFVPGDYVMLAVSDTGPGMDKETLENLFEPFFTTKEVGEGTGLGLATVYGIVKQNSGFINVYSEPGQGTTFKIYFRKTKEEAPQVQDSAAGSVAGGSETVLVVEDEGSILRLIRSLLQRFGYSVLCAGTPSEALALVQEQKRGIDLLLTDVVMPEMDGKELTERLQTVLPELKVLFMSGYTANVIMHRASWKAMCISSRSLLPRIFPAQACSS